MTLDLSRIEGEVLDWRFKGCPPEAFGLRIAEIGKLRLHALNGDGVFPVALLRRTALDHNGAWMRRFLDSTGARICPHGKTTMAPQLFARQLRDGAWGMTAATIPHLRAYRAHGVKRVVFANQLIGKADIQYVLDELERDPDFDFYCLVDSLEGVLRIADAASARSATRPVQLLVEVGAQGGRTGVRDVEGGISLCRAVSTRSPAVSLRGIEAFEGIFGGHEHDALRRDIGAMLDNVVAVALGAEAEGCFAPGPILLTAGGSAFFDLVAERLAKAALHAATEVVLRSGCYLTHDSHHYETYFELMRERSPAVQSMGEGLQPALEIWARVQSLPETGLAIASFGKREASYDIEMPRPIKWLRPELHKHPISIEGASVMRLNDQHAFVRLPADHELRIGDLMGFGISHPCTTFDKWGLLLEVDDNYHVVSAIRTFF